MELLTSLHINALEWTIIMVCGMLIGMSKVGVPGVSMIVVPALAFIFGAKQSTGVLLPILMMADIFGVGRTIQESDRHPCVSQYRINDLAGQTKGNKSFSG